MTKAQAAETLKNIKNKYVDVQQALDKAIEVLSDKTEYVKRSTYRKLKYDYDQLVADASDLKMFLDAERVMDFSRKNEISYLKGQNEYYKKENKRLFIRYAITATFAILLFILYVVTC